MPLQQCRRKPGGYVCQILEEMPDRLKIRDAHAGWTGWVTRDTFNRDWTLVPS